MDSWIEDIARCRSVAIAGLEKNTGKTECLNYLVRHMQQKGVRLALTSIGVDGEKRDRLYGIAKPEIELFPDTWFVTTETHYREKRLTAEILSLGEERTALGRLVTARALNRGKVLLSGPPDTERMKKLIGTLLRGGRELVLVDGALSRMSLASPDVTEAMILATGAAVSGNIAELVRKTKYVYDLICLKETDVKCRDRLREVGAGVWAIHEDGTLRDLQIPSCFLFEKAGKDLFRYGRCFYVSGAVGDRFLNFLKVQREPVKMILRDFTKVFTRPEVFYDFCRRGHRIEVLHCTRLAAICVNPQSPSGIMLDTERIGAALQKLVEVPVINVRDGEKNVI